MSQYGVSRQRIHQIVQQYNTSGSVERVKGTGGKRKTTSREDRRIMMIVLRDREVTAAQIKEQLDRPDLSDTTIYRRIAELSELKSYWKLLKPFINEAQAKRRVRWCKEHLHWTIDQWRKVIWSDESPFTLSYNRRTRVWRSADEKFKPHAIRGTLKHDTKINVWGCFSAHGVGKICRIEGIMYKEDYLDILQEYLEPSVYTLFPNYDYLFQHDNDPKHTANVVKDFIRDEKIPMLEDWPGQSPDLNPIENLWSILNMRLAKRRCRTQEELFQAIQDGWNELPVNILATLVESMPRRLAAVIASKGYPTKY
jgi:transposase